MPFQTKLRIMIDISMTIALLLLMPYSLLGEAAHEWIGLAMFVLFILHHKLNIGWIKNLRKGKYTVSRSLRTITDLLILLAMLGSMASGIVISAHVFSFLPFENPAEETGRAVHLFCGFWGFILMSFHVGLHFGMLRGMINGKTKMRPVLRITALAVACYGAFAFYRRRIVSYLFLQSHFLMFNFDETLFTYLLDMIAIMILFIWIGYGTDQILKSGKRRS